MTENIVSILSDAKAEDIKVIDLSKKSSVADAFVIATCRSTRHSDATADEMVKKLINYASGSARDFFKKNDFYNYKICIGDTNVQKAYSKLTEPFLKKIDLNIRENLKLSSITKLIGPMLINGKLDISNLEPGL